MSFSKAFPVLLAVLATALATCDTTRDGPTPDPTGVEPQEICTACGENLIRIAGDGFSPASGSPLGGGEELLMPRVFLVAPDGAESEIPPIGVTLAAGGSGGQVLAATIPADFVGPTESGAPSVTYDLRILNPNGNEGWLRAAEGLGLTVVAPSYFDLLRIEPPFGWHETATGVTIFSNAGFVSTPSAYMVLHDDDPEAEHEPIPFERVAFIDESTITAVVPAGAPLGVYDVYVVNPAPASTIGVLPGGFTVVDNPVPRVIWVVPSRGTSQADTAVTIYGSDFRAPVRVELIDQALQVAAAIDDHISVTEGQIQTLFPTKSQSGDLPAAPYLVRVTNLDEGSYGSWAAFLVTNPAGNLNTFQESSPMTTGRRLLAGLFANDEPGNRYVYAIGGDTGEGGDVLDTVELAQLSHFGSLGAWRQQKHRLNVPRAGASAVAVPVFDPEGSPFIPVRTYVYVVGGRSDTDEVLDTVERAMVLPASEAPVIASAAPASAAGTLAAGTWYYMVSAVLGTGDPDNPGGETAPSDEAVVALAAEGSISLQWSAVTVNGVAATGYRVYRTDAANGTSWTEHLIAEVTGTSYTDTGDAAGTESPNPPGATGVFTVLAGTLGSPRWGHQALLVHDESGARMLHVLGGKDAVAGGVLDSAEWAPLDDSGSLGGFDTEGATAMTAPRAFFSAAVEDRSNIDTFPTDGSRLWAMGGVTAGGGPTGTLEESDVLTGGGSGAWTVNGKTVISAAGSMAVITNNKLFVLGGATSADDTTFGNITPGGRDTEFDGNGDISGSINSTASSLLAPRALGIGLYGAGFIYFYGGTSDGADALATTERTF
jgi:hypothetical protein